MNDRAMILARIRSSQSVRHTKGLPTQDFTPFLPEVGPSRADRVARFLENARKLRADCACVSVADTQNKLLELSRTHGWRRVAVGNDVYFESDSMTVLDNPAISELATCDVSITRADILIAQTGSVVVSSQIGRAMTILTPHHVVIAKQSQVVGDLPSAFDHLVMQHGRKWPSMISFISGPSRTGDIERILVLGAHGPRELTILIQMD